MGFPKSDGLLEPARGIGSYAYAETMTGCLIPAVLNLNADTLQVLNPPINRRYARNPVIGTDCNKRWRELGGAIGAVTDHERIQPVSTDLPSQRKNLHAANPRSLKS